MRGDGCGGESGRRANHGRGVMGAQGDFAGKERTVRDGDLERARVNTEV